jgi:RNA polymerase sigma factor (sigma-70 family)
VTGDLPADRATQAFLDQRELLFAMVYNLLGTVADTEDVLQETWLAWSARSGSPAGEPIGNPRAYLVRVAVNLALTRQAAIKRRRETYVGPWLPEPLVTPPAGEDDPDSPAAAAERTEALSMALLVVLETLTPLERAVFVLNEAFGYTHPEIAEILGRTPVAVRQVAHRAREHVQARRSRYEPGPAVRAAVTERFLAALIGGDLEAFLRLLAPDVTVWADGGGKARALLRPVSGRDGGARLLAGIAARIPEGLDIRRRRVNGDPSVVLVSGASVFVIVLDLTPGGDQVAGVYIVTNPDKLSRVD